MSYLQVDDLGFPLKDIKVRGDLENQIKMYEQKQKSLYADMIQLKKQIGEIQFNHLGRKAIIEIHRVNNKHPNQIRWRFYYKSSQTKPTLIKSNFIIVLNKNKNKNKKAIQEIFSLKKSAYWKQIHAFEKKRAYLNLAMKSTCKILDELYEIQSLYFIEEEIKKAKEGFISENVTN